MFSYDCIIFVLIFFVVVVWYYIEYKIYFFLLILLVDLVFLWFCVFVFELVVRLSNNIVKVRL